MADGITRIAVEGFKSIAKRQEIEIAPLTILAGANSSGKSSIMQPLLMLKQTLDATFDPGALWISGPNATFTSGQQFFSRIESRHAGNVDIEKLSARLCIELVSGTRAFKTSIQSGNSGFEVVEQQTTDDGRILRFRPDMRDEEISRELAPLLLDGKLSVIRNRFLLDFGIAGSIPVTSQWVEPFVRRMIHVPGSRSNPSRTYPVAAVGPSFPGTFEHYVASVVLSWQSHDHPRHHALNADLHHLHLAQKVLARKLSDTEIDLQVSRLPEGDSFDMVSVADVGLGLSHVLPALVGLRAAQEEHIVYVEQPEIHLHPRAQTKLADILADAAKRGVRVVAETHSTLLLTAIQTLVAKGELSPDLVKLHWFQRDPKTGITQVNSTDLDRNGAFREDWPEDFDQVILDTDRQYLDAVTERSSG